jgi:hypothetical protein
MRRSLFQAVLLSALAYLLVGAPVMAFPLTNCTLQATSLKADGSTVDAIASGAADATQDHPFLVDWDGTVKYSGNSQIAMKDNTWHVDVFGIPTPLTGGDPNAADSRDGSGTVGVSANAPFRITGLYFVSGSITGSGGTCTGSGWFKLTGDPLGTIPFFVALGILVLGLVMLLLGFRGHAITAVLGGILTGLGAGAMLVLYSTLPLGSPTPIAAIVLGAILGVLTALIGRRTRGTDTPPMLPPMNSGKTPEGSTPA